VSEPMFSPITQLQWMEGLKIYTYAYARFDERPREVQYLGYSEVIEERYVDLGQAALAAEAHMRKLYGEQPQQSLILKLLEAVEVLSLTAWAGSGFVALGLTAAEAKTAVEEIRKLAGIPKPEELVTQGVLMKLIQEFFSWLRTRLGASS